MYTSINSPTALKVNTMPCQFTAELSKTKNALNYIKKITEIYDLNDASDLYDNCSFHKICIIYTNNSLEETRMWKTRTSNCLKDLIIWTLSSKQDSTFNNLATIQDALLGIKTSSELPNVIIMCGHDKRANDMITLIQRFETQIKLHLSINKAPIFEIFFDEADKQISVITKFLRSPIVRKEEGIAGSLTSIMFISATLYDGFWKMLQNEGINSGLDFSWLTEVIENTAQDKGFESFGDYFDSLLKQYRKISDHNIIKHDNLTFNPVDYVRDCFQIKNDDNTLKFFQNNNDKPFVVYSPAKNTIKSHNEMSNFYLSNGWACLVHNGTYKEFRFPDKTTITIENFRKKFHIDGELFEVLIKFCQEYPTLNLGITGHNTVERGITFNTVGFQFTHCILSTYHSQKLETLLQMLGRNDGDKKFVGTFNIISTTKIFKIANNAVDRLTNLILTKPEQITYEHFSNIDDPDYNNKTVPIVVELNNEEFKIFEKKGNRYNKSAIVELLQLKYNWINNDEYNIDTLLQISAPGNTLSEKATKTKQTAYEKLLLPGVESYRNNKRMVIGLKIKGTSYETTKCWGIFVDIVLKNRVIIYRWDGKII